MNVDVVSRLAQAPLAIHGRIVNASNHTMLVETDDGDAPILAVYKPRAGERPLWDFPPGSLHQREVAAYEVSQALGWEVVPPTLLRDGPLGTGSVQLFIDHDPRRHYFALLEDDRYDTALAQMAVFDLLVNNADRKGGHVLLARDEHIWGCDHGLTFHVEPKLRTVIWEFGGMRLPEAWCEALRGLEAELGADAGVLRNRLVELLSAAEVEVLRLRAAALVSTGVLPNPAEDERPYPWPPI